MTKTELWLKFPFNRDDWGDISFNTNYLRYEIEHIPTGNLVFISSGEREEAMTELCKKFVAFTEDITLRRDYRETADFCPSTKKPSWDDTFLEIMEVISRRSDDPTTKVGCVIVSPDNTLVSLGYNGVPRGCPNDLAHTARPQKYYYIEHADRNAIYNAQRSGANLKGCKMYLPWLPCADCARAIIQCGITEVVVPQKYIVQERWKESCNAGLEMMGDAGVFVRPANMIVNLVKSGKI